MLLKITNYLDSEENSRHIINQKCMNVNSKFMLRCGSFF